MIAKRNEVGKQIERLRTSLQVTPAELARELGVSTGRVSEWERGVRPPSPQGLLKLGALAAKSDASAALFFWEQTGLDSGLLISLVDALIRTGRTDPGPLLPTTEAILKQQLGDQKALVETGEVVLVPPYTGGHWEGSEGAPLPLPAFTVLNMTSTFYLCAHHRDSHADRLNRGIVNGDLIVFDTSGTAARKFDSSLERLVLVNFTGPRAKTPQSGSWREGLFVGVLTLSPEDDAYWLVLTPPEEIVMLSRRGERHSVPHVLARLASFRIEDYLPQGYSPARTTDRSKDRLDHLDAIHAAESAALSELMVPEGCEIMGEIIARFSSTGPGLRLQWERWPAEQLERLEALEKLEKLHKGRRES